MGKYKKLLVVKIRVIFFISHLGLERSLGKLNEQSFQSVRGKRTLFYVRSASIPE